MLGGWRGEGDSRAGCRKQGSSLPSVCQVLGFRIEPASDLGLSSSRGDTSPGLEAKQGELLLVLQVSHLGQHPNVSQPPSPHLQNGRDEENS